MINAFVGSEVGYENLHLHTDNSLLDGFGMVEEYAERATKINQKFLCVTDHGMMGAVPRQIRACEEHGISPLFGIEFYYQPDHPGRDGFQQMDAKQKAAIRKSYHLTAIAHNETGFRNLVRGSSWAWTEGFYYKPRINKETLLKHREGVTFLSGCYNSPVGQAFERGGAEAADEQIRQFMEMFGEHFMLEIMLLDFEKQKPYDAYIVKAGEKFNLPIVVSNDCHYCNKEDSLYQRYMLMIAKKTTVADIERRLNQEDRAEIFELQDQNLWFKSEAELNAKWAEAYQSIVPRDVFVRAKENSVKVCQKAKGVQLDRSVKLPQLPNADQELKERLVHGFKWRGLAGKPEYMKRLREEYDLICRKEFSSYFLIQKKIVDEARRVAPSILGFGDGSEAVGPGRGCLAGNSSVVTDSGFVALSDIKVGDKVMTRTGNYLPVSDVMKYEINEPTVNVRCFYGDKDGITMTLDHKVLVERMVRLDGWDKWAFSTRKARHQFKEPTGNLEWVKAQDVSVGDWVFVPKPNLPVTEPGRTDLAEFCDDDVLKFHKNLVIQDRRNPLTGQIRSRKVCGRWIDHDEDFFYALGVFVGDGWVRSTSNGQVGFCFHTIDNMDSMERVVRWIERCNVKYSVRFARKKRVVQVFVLSKYWEMAFKKFLPDYRSTSGSKHVPPIVFSAPDRMKRAFLRGYIASDGSSSAEIYKVCSVSRRLIEEIRVVCWSLGLPCSHSRSNRCDPRSGHRWVENVGRIPKFDDNGNIVSRAYGYRSVDGGLLLRVSGKKDVTDVKTVYDITVPGESNYTTSSFVVHNSAVGSLVCYCLGITDVDPIHHGLLFSRFLSEARGGKTIRTKFTRPPIGKRAA